MSVERRAGFWQAPRWLADMRDDSEMTASTFALVMWVGVKGHDQYGLSTTRSDLAEAIGREPKTISRSLEQASWLGLLRHDLRQGRKRVRVWLGPGLTSDTTSDNGSDADALPGSTSDSTSDIDPASDVRGRGAPVRSGDDPRTQAGCGVELSADEGGVRSAKTETENKGKPLSNEEYVEPEGSAVDARTRAREDDLGATDALLGALGLSEELPSDEDSSDLTSLPGNEADLDDGPTLDEALRDPELFACHVAPYAELLPHGGGS